ncbi:MAG TPA: AraC family transcriptional regulator [Opitutaceae bacterium]|jgi:AraC-like DNA-binding protein
MKAKAARRDGFTGQHLLVLPAPLGREAAQHPLLAGILVTDAGYFPKAANHLVERPGGATTALVILCLDGSGWVQGKSARQKISAGDFVWMPANEGHAYGSGSQDPWTILWAHFTGTELQAWEEMLGVRGEANPSVLALPDDRLDEIALDRVFAALERGFAERHLVAAAAALRSSLSTVVQMGRDVRDPRSAAERVAQSISALRCDWLRPHRLEELSKAANVSIAHYSSLFRLQTGFSPIDFLIRLRIGHACRLLDTTSLLIGEVGERAGYQDPYYFTRCFRRVMGCSPRSYRKVPKG